MFGIQPSRVAQDTVLDARAVAADVAPGRDRRGFGHCQIGSKSTCLPWYSGSSCVQIAFMASTRSRISPCRVAGSVPWLSSSGLFQPAPIAEHEPPAGQVLQRA